MVQEHGRWQVVKRGLLYVLIFVLCGLFIFPAVWTLTNSLQSIAGPVGLFPTSAHWSNYVRAVTMIPFARYLANSFIIVGLAAGIGTISSAFVGYGFARLKAPGKSVLFIVVLATMMLPGIVTQIPTYILFSHLGLTNTYLPWLFWGIGGNAFFIFLYRQFFMGIPVELEEAARLDGCSSFGIFWRIFIPLSFPIVATTGILSFQGSWSDALTPFMFLSTNQWPLATALIGSSDYSLPSQPTVPLIPVVDAATLLFVIPILLLFFMGQRFIIQGVVTTGLKG